MGEPNLWSHCTMSVGGSHVLVSAVGGCGCQVHVAAAELAEFESRYLTFRESRKCW
jgi:hypothetical protein